MLSEVGSLPGDLKKFEVTIDGIDISQSVTSVTVFQDMFTPTWTAAIDVYDTNNILMNVPIRPASRVEITVISDMKSITDDEMVFRFVVSGISDKNFKNTMWQTYTVNCVCEDFMKNLGNRVQFSMVNTTPIDICKNIVSRYLQKQMVNDESDSPAINYVGTNLSPFAAIHQLAKIIKSDNAADFLFFMKDYEKYSMQSIEKIYEKDPIFTFMMRPTNTRNRDTGNIDIDYNLCITNYHFEHYDSSSNFSSGMYANTITKFNLLSKSWSEKTFRFGDDTPQDRAVKPWEDDALIEQIKANISFVPEHGGLSQFGNTMNDLHKDTIQSRKSSLMKLEQDKLIIQLPGGVKHTKSLGESVNIELPSQQDIEEDEYDKQFEGKYIPVAISHYFAKHAYFTNYELVKKRHKTKMASRAAG